MNSDVKMQVRDYFVYVDETQAMELPVVPKRVGEDGLPGFEAQTDVIARPVTGSASRARVLVPVAVALVAIGLLVVRWLAPLASDPAGSSVPPPTPTSVVVPSTTPGDNTQPPTGSAQQESLDSMAGETFASWTSVSGPEGAVEIGGWGTVSSDSNGFVYITSNWFATSVDGVEWDYTQLRPGTSEPQECTVWDGVLLCTSGGGAIGVDNGPITPLPSFVHVSQPDNTMSTFRIDGDIHAAAVGGQGILVASNLALSHENLLGETSELGLSTSTIEDGILYGTYTDGSTKEVDLAELGIDPEDFERTIWWYSDDGVEWIKLPVEAPFDVQRMLGTEEGFYAVDGARAWFTSDGRTWEELGGLPEEAFLTRGADGRPVATSREGVVYLDQLPLTLLPLADTPDQPYPFVTGATGTLLVGLWDQSTGDIHPVTLRYAEHGQPLQQEADIPAAMEAANTFGMWMPTGAAIGDRYLLLLFEGDFTPTFWIKDFAQP